MTAAVRKTLSRFLRISKPYFISNARRRALGLLAALFALLLAIAGLNVGISYVGRDFMTALARRQPHQVYMFALMYLGVFAASAAAGAFAKFFELLLGLRWREWLTEHFVRQYLSSQAYFRVNAHTEVDNPDERISEDLRTFTSTALSFLIMVTNSVITLLAFIGVLWSITPWLVVAGVLYPLLGTSAIVVIGRHLVHLNHLQLKKEADFRFELVHVRTHAESVALVQSERKAEARLGQRLGALVTNYRSIITVLRNLQFVKGGYDYMDQLIPVLIVAPMYMRGEVEFGVVTQAAMVFSQVFNAFSLIAEQFQDLSAFAAVVGRVGSLDEAIAEAAEASRQPIQVAESDTPLAYQQVTLRNSPKDDRPLVQDLSLEVPRGEHVLLTGPNTTGKSAARAAPAAGLWAKGSGCVSHRATAGDVFARATVYGPWHAAQSIPHRAGRNRGDRRADSRRAPRTASRHSRRAAGRSGCRARLGKHAFLRPAAIDRVCAAACGPTGLRLPGRCGQRFHRTAARRSLPPARGHGDQLSQRRRPPAKHAPEPRHRRRAASGRHLVIRPSQPSRE